MAGSLISNSQSFKSGLGGGTLGIFDPSCHDVAVDKR